MAPTIEELDATVRAFYEGRGESVSITRTSSSGIISKVHLLTRLLYSKRLLKPHLTRYVLPCADVEVTLPTSANTLVQFKEDPDAWLLVDKILQEATYPQTKCQSPSPLTAELNKADKWQTWGCKSSIM